MNTQVSKLGTVSVSSWLTAPDRPAGAAPRLMVVISDVSEEAPLAGRILALAKAGGLRVSLLGAAADEAHETELRRKLITVSAFIGADGWPVEIQTECGKAWIGRLQAERGQADTIACYAEQGVGPWREPLSDVLSRALQVPIRDLSPLRSPTPYRRAPLSRALAWLGSAALIVGFFSLQATIVGSLQGVTQEIVLFVTLPTEVGLIWLWNSLFG